MNIIHDRGVSDRTLAKELNCSATKIRYLRMASGASWQDQLRARVGEISTRELVTLARKLTSEQLAKEGVAHDQQITRKAQEGSEAICSWLEAEGLSEGQGESIINEARRILVEADQDRTLSRVALYPGNMQVSEIIQRARPPRSVNDDVGSPGWYADWLVRWVFCAMKDTAVCHSARNIALDKQIAG